MAARRWTYEENNILLECMMKNYEYLTNAVAPNKTKAMVDKNITSAFGVISSTVTAVDH